jgi:hypothetical protein
VYVSEIYQTVKSVPGVADVRRPLVPKTGAPLDELVLRPGLAGRLRHNRLGELEAIELQANELPKLQPEESSIAL